MATGKRRTDRLTEYSIAAALAVVVLIVSPLGIEFMTGRPELSFRVNVVSLVCVVFLVTLIAAVLAQGRLRQICFYAVALVFPFTLLAGLEGIALKVRLADIVAPLEDTSLLENKTPWPTYLLSDASYYQTPDGLLLYHEWHGNGISFNKLGLRAPMPTPKAPGEWRIAVTGGSAAWGWYVRDADTIPARLQEVLRRQGHANVTVYNFGIGGATLARELQLLQRYRDIYALDQVLFYTGGNDAYLSYIGSTEAGRPAWLGRLGQLELMKTTMRLQAIWSTPTPQMLRHLDDEVLPLALKNNSLRAGVVATDEYCRASNLVCDFVLQPMMFERKTHSGSEAVMASTLARIYPRLDTLTARMFGEALAAGPAGHIFDFAHIFDGKAEPFFLDFVHLNEAGNRIAAERVAPIVAARLP